MSTFPQFSVEEDDRLIENAKVHPALYDMKHKPKDQIVKDQIWNLIAEDVGRTAADCRRRWKNIKDTYDRKMRERIKFDSGATPSKKGKRIWVLEEKLKFLRNSSPAGRTTSTTNGYHQWDVQDNYQSNDVVVDVDLNYLSDTSIREQDSHAEYEAESQTNKEFQSDYPTERKDMNFKDQMVCALEQRLKEKDEIIRKLLHPDPGSDDIGLFFQSIAATVRKFPNHFQQQAKLETLTTISKIETNWIATGSSQRLTSQHYSFEHLEPPPLHFIKDPLS